jgi:hypothetical protein
MDTHRIRDPTTSSSFECMHRYVHSHTPEKKKKTEKEGVRGGSGVRGGRRGQRRKGGGERRNKQDLAVHRPST